MADRSTAQLDSSQRKTVLLDIIGLAGAAAIVEGMREIRPAAAWIVGGLFALVFAWFMARAEAVRP